MRLNGRFFFETDVRSWGTTYVIRFMAPEFPEPRIVREDGSCSFSGWGREADRELYLSLWTDTELEQFLKMYYEMYSRPPQARMKISNLIEKLKKEVQKRGGKQLRDS